MADCLHKGGPEGDSFSGSSSCPGEGGRYSYVVYPEVSARLGTLNTIIPSLSKVA